MPTGEVAADSMAGLAFLAAGAKPDDPASPHGADLRRCLDIVRDRAHPAVGIVCASGDWSPTGSHAGATILLAEYHRLAPGDEALTERLLKAVRFIERTQRADGGWGQAARKASVSRWTALQLEALFAARAAGVGVDAGVVKRGVGFLRACERPDVGIADRPNPARTADAALYAMPMAYALVPLYHAEPGEAARRLERLMDMNVATRPGGRHLLIAAHAARAAYLEGGTYRATAYPAFCRQIVDHQAPDGRWRFSTASPVEDTALALIVLQMPRERLVSLTPRPGVAAREAQGNPATRPVSRPAGAP